LPVKTKWFGYFSRRNFSPMYCNCGMLSDWRVHRFNRVEIVCENFCRNCRRERNGEGDIGSSDLHNDLPLGPALFEICQRILRLIEWKHLVNQRPDAPRLEQFTDLRELLAVWMREQE
jgi:hypothetical protein